MYRRGKIGSVDNVDGEICREVTDTKLGRGGEIESMISISGVRCVGVYT